MANKKRMKYIRPEMEYNPGFSKFEPVLPTVKNSKKFKQERNWIAYIVVITEAIVCAIIFYYALKIFLG